MKEPSTLAEQLHVLVTMDGRTHIITREQALQITAAQNSGTVKTVSIGNCPITIHQIAGMPTLDVYRRQMKTKLAEKHQRMCRRCGAVLAIQDFCSCKDNDVMPFMAQAAKENPALKTFLIQSGMEALALPPPKVAELPEAPPTPKEREQMKTIQAAKDQFLGKVSMPSVPLPDCDTCKNERQFLFKGTMVKCDCTLRRSSVSKKQFGKEVQSGTLSPTRP